ncbi:hypothetical protein [Candidatus Anaplasma sp. TIGMIC]|uniref:hypothetical protein n=1 Tax=Candidatus Anaplasma sp. TIGMIC TaxID=3020713 RepID=UPI0023308227|nr:hypothetical protein [Candidatus Anaplasma sp. TIGMIC]MDB1135724.1 hypothetical protein [Candidatus Anaplasma sp. TIGMIC]
MFNDATVNSLDVDNLHNNISQDFTNSPSGYLGISSSDVTYDLVIESHIGRSDSDKSYIAVVNTSGDVVAMYLDAYVQDFLLLCKNTASDQVSDRNMLLLSQGLSSSEHSIAFDNITTTLGNASSHESAHSTPIQHVDDETNDDDTQVDKGSSIVGGFIASVARFMGLNAADSPESNPATESAEQKSEDTQAASGITSTESENRREVTQNNDELKDVQKQDTADDFWGSVFGIVPKAETSSVEVPAASEEASTPEESYNAESGIAAATVGTDEVAIGDVAELAPVDSSNAVATQETVANADTAAEAVAANVLDSVSNIVSATENTTVDTQAAPEEPSTPEESHNVESGIAAAAVSAGEVTTSRLEEQVSAESGNVVPAQAPITDVLTIAEPMTSNIWDSVFDIAKKKSESDTTEVATTHSVDMPAPDLSAPLVSETQHNTEPTATAAVSDDSQTQHNVDHQSGSHKESMGSYYDSDFVDLGFLTDEEIGLFGDLL